MDDRLRYSDSAGPLSDRQPFALIFDEYVSPSVVGLRLKVCPPAIRWLIIAIGVDSVNGQRVVVPMSERPILERSVVMPFRADPNSPGPIQPPIALTAPLREFTAFDHSLPYRVNATIRSAARVSVFDVGRRVPPTDATAGFLVPALEVGVDGDDIIAAIAATIERSSAMLVSSRISGHDEPSVTAAYDVLGHYRRRVFPSRPGVASRLIGQAAAGGGVSVEKIGRPYDAFIPAVAAASPPCLSFWSRSVSSDNGKPSEFPSGEVPELAHTGRHASVCPPIRFLADER